MNTYLKYGGLAFSAALTMSLFARLFGVEAYGIMLAIAALVLFEGGAIAWERMLEHAEGAQRGIAYGALWFCAITSVVSSCAEIILATHLWTPAFDIEFTTLVIISLALAVNILGALAFTQLDPDTAEKHRELDRLAKEALAQNNIEDMYMTHSIMEAKRRAKGNAKMIADDIGEELKENVTRKFTQRKRGPVVTPYARESSALPMSTTAAAGGGGELYTRDEVKELIAQAIAQARAESENERKGNTRPKAQA